MVTVLGACADALPAKIAAVTPSANAAIRRCFFLFMMPPLLQRNVVAYGGHPLGRDADSPSGIPPGYQWFAVAERAGGAPPLRLSTATQPSRAARTGFP